MAAILEFVRSESAVFDPETVQTLACALDDAWARIEKAGSRYARPGYSRAMREVVAKRIIERAGSQRSRAAGSRCSEIYFSQLC